MKGHGKQERCLKTGIKTTSLQFSKRAGRRTQETTGHSASPEGYQEWSTQIHLNKENHDRPI